MKIKTSELSGYALDCAVYHCVWRWSREFPIMPLPVPPYSTDWAQGGPIIEREKINISVSATAPWMAWFYDGLEMLDLTDGATPLIAAMRCYVASKLGDEVEVSKELINGQS